jgi:hypothetical protein
MYTQRCVYAKLPFLAKQWLGRYSAQPAVNTVVRSFREARARFQDSPYRPVCTGRATVCSVQSLTPPLLLLLRFTSFLVIFNWPTTLDTRDDAQA